MKKLLLAASLVILPLTTSVIQAQTPPAATPLRLGEPGPNLAAGKAPDQGYVPDAWSPHTGSLLRYRVAIRFGMEPKTTPSGFDWGRISAVTHDAAGNVYVFHRGASDPIVVFDSLGVYQRSFGEGVFDNEHGLRIDRDGFLWAVDNGSHTVTKMTLAGEVLRQWGTKGVAGSTPTTFARPTDIAWDSHGNFYVSDGYTNSRVVKFDNDGSYVTAWGTPGDGPGQFRLPHSIAIDSHDRVYVSDRENNRIQIFDTDGNVLEIWNHLGATQGIFITPDDEMWVLTHRNNTENIAYDTLAGQLMKIDLETGTVLGAMESPGHLITVAPDGKIYVASLTGNVFRWAPSDSRWP